MPKYIIVKLEKLEPMFERIRDAKLISAVVISGYAIIARYGVNKTTLKKILKKELAK